MWVTLSHLWGILGSVQSLLTVANHQAWCCTPVILASQWQRQEDLSTFSITSLSYRVKPCLFFFFNFLWSGCPLLWGRQRSLWTAAARTYLLITLLLCALTDGSCRVTFSFPRVTCVRKGLLLPAPFLPEWTCVCPGLGPLGTSHPSCSPTSLGEKQLHRKRKRT